MTTSSGASPSSVEQAVISALTVGQWADFPASDNAVIPADLVRRLVMGLPVTSNQRVFGRLPTGVRIRNATIRGMIDLQGARLSDGSSCNGLELEGCIIAEESDLGGRAAVDLRDAVIDCLRLDNCSVRSVDFTASRIGGDVNLIGIHAPENDGECWIAGIEARIDGSVVAHGAQLRVIEQVTGRTYPPIWRAFNLDYSQVTGGVWLEQEISGERFRADGGVSLEGATVGGDLWIHGAHIKEASLDETTSPRSSQGWYHNRAVSLRYGRIGGSLRIRPSGQYGTEGEIDPEPNLLGSVDISHVRVGAALELNKVHCPSTSDSRTEFLAVSIDVQGEITVEEFRGATLNAESVRAHSGIRLTARRHDNGHLILSRGLADGPLTLTVDPDANIKIDLTGFQCVGLDDDDGAAWRGVRGGESHLDGFEYGRILKRHLSSSPRINTTVRSTADSRSVRSQVSAVLRYPFELLNVWVRRLARVAVAAVVILCLIVLAGVLVVTSVFTSGQNAFLRESLSRLRHRVEPSVDVGIHARLEWLSSQYTNPAAPTADEFRPQPYEHLAKVFRTEGNYEAANEVTFRRLQLQRQVNDGPLTSALKLLALEVPFKYGLSVSRAFATFALFIVIGWMGTEAANYGQIRVLPIGTGDGGMLFNLALPLPTGGILVIDAVTVSSVASDSLTADDVRTLRPATERADADGVFVRALACGDEIETLFYAVDTFIPLLDLRQETRCTISGNEDAWGWRFAKGLYGILGWIVTSLTVLTATGVIRRQVEH